jgi:hypothetical protein
VDLDCAGVYSMGQTFGPGGTCTLSALEPGPPAEQLAPGTSVPEEPVAFRVVEKRKVGDLVGTGFTGLVVASPALVGCLTEHGFTGWSTFPIRVEGLLADGLAGYRGLSITGRSGPIDDGLSERVVLPPYVPGAPSMPHRKGFCPEPGSWDGSDLFVPEGTFFRCVTSSVRDALVSARLVGLGLQRMSDMTMLIWDE